MDDEELADEDDPLDEDESLDEDELYEEDESLDKQEEDLGSFLQDFFSSSFRLDLVPS